MNKTQSTKKTTKYCGQIGDYKIIRQLTDQGAQATLLQGHDKHCQDVVIKIFQQKSTFKREANALLKIGQHPGLISLLDIMKKAELKIYRLGQEQKQIVSAIVMEKGKIDLFQIIQMTEGFSQKAARFFFKQLLQAVHQMHMKEVAHCDIKLENIILDRQGNMKVIDFGLAHEFDDHKPFGMYRKCLGTPGYMAPEAWTKNLYDVTKIDLFSLSVVLFIMVYGCPPFSDTNSSDKHFEQLQNNPRQYANFMSQLNPNVGDDFKDLMFKMLSSNPQKRLSYEQILEHPWYNAETATYREAVSELNMKLNQAQK